MGFFKTAATLHALEKVADNERAQAKQNQIINEQNDRITGLEEELRRARRANDNYLPAPSGREMDLERKVQELGDIENLLARPMKEIAEKNFFFKHTYMKQQELLSNWMVSQKAFHEIALRYGKALGKSVEEVLVEVRQAETTVIEGRAEFGSPMNPMAKEALGYGARHAVKVVSEEKEKKKRFLKIQRGWLADWEDLEKKRPLSKEETDKRDDLIKEIGDMEAELAMPPATPELHVKSAFSYIEEAQAEAKRGEAEEFERRRKAQREADESHLGSVERSLERWRLVEKQRELTSEDKEKIGRIQNLLKECKERLGLA